MTDISISIWGAIWIGGRSKLVVIKTPKIATSFTNTRYIRKVLIPIVKPTIKRGKLSNLYFCLKKNITL